MTLDILSLESTCTGCCACLNVCRQDALQLTENTEGFVYPCVDRKKCNLCRMCERVCPVLNPQTPSRERIQNAYYGWHQDDNVRKKSSSGGIFSGIAECCLKDNGVVFGTIYDYEQRRLLHCSSDERDWSLQRKSKYVQSYIGFSFQQTKRFLKEGRRVLFVGTPCQIDGLLSFLRKADDKLLENLLCCDFICHGVPSGKFLDDYLSFLEKKKKSTLLSVDFRPKMHGWAVQMLACTFKNGSQYAMVHTHDPYMNSFLKNYTLRKSCYTCRYAGQQHLSDITLADFWGYRKFDPNIGDEKGLSLVLINSEKGKKYLQECDAAKMTLRPLPWQFAEYVFKEHSSDPNYVIEKRNAFFEDYLTIDLKKVIDKYQLRGMLEARLKYSIKFYIKKIASCLKFR